jgi:hypothetical protein
MNLFYRISIKKSIVIPLRGFREIAFLEAVVPGDTASPDQEDADFSFSTSFISLRRLSAPQFSVTGNTTPLRCLIPQ